MRGKGRGRISVKEGEGSVRDYPPVWFVCISTRPRHFAFSVAMGNLGFMKSGRGGRSVVIGKKEFVRLPSVRGKKYREGKGMCRVKSDTGGWYFRGSVP